MHQEATQSEVPQGSVGETITVNLPCLKCGFNLLGIARRANCPQCNKPASESAKANRLHLASPAWVGKVVAGFNWITIGVIVLGGLSVATITGGTLYSLARGFFFPTISDDHEYFVVPIMLIYGVMFIMPALAYFTLPIWLFTAPEPGVVGWQIIRRATRWLAVGGGIVSLLILPLTIAGPMTLYTVWGGICVVCWWLWAAVLIGLGLQMILLVWRAPYRRLIAETAVLILLISGAVWGLVIALIIALAGFIGNAIGTAEQEETIAEVSRYISSTMIVLSFIIYTIFLALAVWLILLFHRYNKAFLRVRREMEGIGSDPAPVSASNPTTR